MLLEKKTTKQHYTINVNNCKVQGSTFLSSSVIDEDEQDYLLGNSGKTCNCLLSKCGMWCAKILKVQMENIEVKSQSMKYERPKVIIRSLLLKLKMNANWRWKTYDIARYQSLYIQQVVQVFSKQNYQIRWNFVSGKKEKWQRSWAKCMPSPNQVRECPFQRSDSTNNAWANNHKNHRWCFRVLFIVFEVVGMIA